MKSKNIPVDIKSKSIEEAQNEIKEIIKTLENSETNLEQSLDKYNRMTQLNNNIQEKFKRCDDLWLSAFLEAHNIKRYVVPCMELSQNTYKFIIKELYNNRPERPPRWRDKPPHPHVRYTDHVYAINGGKYETQDIFTEIVETFRHEG